MKTLAERIQLIKDETGLSLERLGEISGVSAQAVQQWISGHTKNIRFDPLFRLSRGTGYSAEWIATGEGPIKSQEKTDPALIIDMKDFSVKRREFLISAVKASVGLDSEN
jgi:transcriptional regulator with XRE-family HTH domain